MATCFIHRKAVFDNNKSCPQCKNCKHTNFWKDGVIYKCSNCNLETKTKPTAECYQIINRKWEAV